MGSEAYGLVGFFAMLQAWFGILDLGLTPTIGRETARYRGGALSALDYRRLYRTLSALFLAIALIGGLVLFLLSEKVATDWLTIEKLPLNDVIIAVQVMVVCVALRWMSGLYRGVITGSECLIWLSAFNTIFATLRFVGVLLVMWYFEFTPVVFFIYQLIVSLIEVVVLMTKSKLLIPCKSDIIEKIGWSINPIKPILKFSLTIAFTSSIWVFVTQTDKLVLSGILPLAEYGYFTLSVLIANGIMVISGPISSAVMPRMARLHAENMHEEMIGIYRKSTQLVAIIAGSAAITLTIAATPLLVAWTGDITLAEKVTPLLRLYVAGNAFLVIAAFAYYLQYAKGNLKYHLIGNLALVIVLIPSIIYAATNYGGIGAGFVWLVTNALYLLIWVGYIHHKLEPGLHIKWLFKDTLVIMLPALFLGCLIQAAEIKLETRLENLLAVIVIASITLLTSFFMSSHARSLAFKKLSTRFNK
jgi:O-antigen/teichoic acid export membrane protein